MADQTNSSERPPKGGWISSLIDLVLSYYAGLVSQPLRNGLIYFLAGLMPALFVGWVLYPMVLYSKQQQPFNFSHAIHMDPDMVDGIEGDTDLEKCLFCHLFRDDGTFAGIPRLEKCMECHDENSSRNMWPMRRKYPGSSIQGSPIVSIFPILPM